MEQVDILKPPTFEKTGVTKTLKQAWEDENWIGTFNLWIVQKQPVPSLVYQVRSLRSSWEPGKLDVTAGGHYSAGEELADGLREIKEELGITYEFEQVTYLGKRLNVSLDVNGKHRNNAVDISIIHDDRPITDYILEEAEVYAICSVPLAELRKVHTREGYQITVSGLTSTGETIPLEVNRNAFPYNLDNYHFKMVSLAERFLQGEKHLIY